jgi:hypothetical protein
MHVTPSNMNGWSFFTEGSSPTAGTLVAGPPGAPIGSGSARLPVSALTQGQSLGTGAYAGTRLADITALGYSSHRETGSSLAVQHSGISMRPRRRALSYCKI